MIDPDHTYVKPKGEKKKGEDNEEMKRKEALLREVDLDALTVVPEQGAFVELGSVWLVVNRNGGRPRIVTVNKQAQGFYALYGEERYIDTRDDTSTGLPLQWVFRGWNDEGMSEFRSTTGINTQTPCADLKIAYEIKECLYDQSRHEPRACPEIHLNGEGFAGIVIETDRSQDLPEIEGTE